MVCLIMTRAGTDLGQSDPPDNEVAIVCFRRPAAELSPNLGDGLRDQAAAVWD